MLSESCIGGFHVLSSCTSCLPHLCYIPKYCKCNNNSRRITFKSCSWDGLTVGNRLFLRPYLEVFLRPYLEYCVQPCASANNKVIDEIKQVQWRAAKMVRGLKHSPCEKRLR